MRRRKRTLVMIETKTISSFNSAHSSSAWCQVCNADTILMTPSAAAALLEVSTRVIYQQIEVGGVHFEEAPDGSLHICINSLNQLNP